MPKLANQNKTTHAPGQPGRKEIMADKSVSIRDVPPELWQEFKVQCAIVGVPMRVKVLVLIAEWLEKRREEQR
ncbi:MAG: hypothetical protein M0P69_06065 [Bacteroidales bacterium]|nr:hypothetical protein [Bacteroidales bacterium]